MTDAERNALIARLLGEGNSLSDVQKILENEHDLRLTYMDLRLIASELEVDWSQFDPKPEPEPEAPEAQEAEGTIEPDEDDVTMAAGIKVTISQLSRPGAIFHGDVEFRSGAKGEWYIDQSGRLGLNPEEGSGHPTQDDVVEFQQELQRLVSQQMGGAI